MEVNIQRVEHDLRRIEHIYSRLYIIMKIPVCNTGTRNYVNMKVISTQRTTVNGKKEKRFRVTHEFNYSVVQNLAPVVQRLDNAIHRINHYPADSVVCCVNTYPLDSDLSGGQRNPAFEQLGPDMQSKQTRCALIAARLHDTAHAAVGYSTRSMLFQQFCKRL